MPTAQLLVRSSSGPQHIETPSLERARNSIEKELKCATPRGGSKQELAFAQRAGGGFDPPRRKMIVIKKKTKITFSFSWQSYIAPFLCPFIFFSVSLCVPLLLPVHSPQSSSSLSRSYASQVCGKKQFCPRRRFQHHGEHPRMGTFG